LQERLTLTKRVALTASHTTTVEEDAITRGEHNWRKSQRAKMSSSIDRRNWNEQRWEEPAWANNDSIEKLIKFIRESKGKIPNLWEAGPNSHMPNNHIIAHLSPKALSTRMLTVRSRFCQSPVVKRKCKIELKN
jgi:hypothetical protein